MTPHRSHSLVAARRGIERLYFHIVQGTVVAVAALQMLIAVLTRRGPVISLPLYTLYGVLLLLCWYGGRSDRTPDEEEGKPWGLLFGFIAILVVVLCAETGGIASPYVPLVFATCGFAALVLPANRAIGLTVFTTGFYIFTAILQLHANRPILDGGYETLGAMFRSLPSITSNEVSALVVHAAFFFLATFIAQRVARDFNSRMNRAEFEANVDPLTGLPNRRGFTEKLQLESERMMQLDWSIAMLVIDLDHFKRVNDEFDHGIGDAVLVSAAVVLRDAVGPVDHVARIGGEEFAVAAVGADLPHAQETANRIVKAFRAHPWATITPGLGPVTCSVGVAVGTPSDSFGRKIEFDALIQDADHALLVAKRHGRNQVRIAGEIPPPPTGDRLVVPRSESNQPPPDPARPQPEFEPAHRRVKFIRR